jgi:DNA-binding MurR/RpiR family transcriptional regulator
MAPQDVISDLRRSYDELTQSQKRIAEAIVEDPEFVAFATVDKLAARLGVSPSTVVRFAYRLGLNGYQDLQDRVRTVVRSQMRANVGAGGDPAELTGHLGESIFAESLAHDVENLRKTVLNLNVEDLERGVAALVEARRVYVIGGLTSYSVAFYAALALDRIRGEAVLLTGDERSASSLLSMTEADTLLAFTFPPYASSTVRVAAWAKAHGATVVAVTDTPISPVGQRVDVVLPAVASGVSSQNSLIGSMAVANALLNGVIVRSPDAVDRYRRILNLMNDWDLYVLKGDDGG